MAKATIKELKEFFDSPAVQTKEMMRLKKDPVGPNGEPPVELPDYDEIANGIGDGTFTYPDVSEDRKAIASQRTDALGVPQLRS